MADVQSEKKRIGDSAQVVSECEEIDGEITALKVAYEQFFLGVERRPPTTQHDALKKRLNQLRNTFVRQTAATFRVSTVYNRFLTYERMWKRTLQEIENGTYHRDLFKARLHARGKGVEKPAEKAAADQTAAAARKAEPGPTDEVDDADRPTIVPRLPGEVGGQAGPSPPGAAGRAPAPVAAKASPPPPPSAVGPKPVLSDAKVKAIYDAYVTAKKRCNEDVSKLSFDAVAATLRRQVPELMKTHKARSVEFRVMIKDGKAVLKAVPKE